MASLLPGGSLGRYQVVEEIGRGGMAVVFRAFDPRLERDVAVKVLPSHSSEDPTYVERFRNEARAVARLNHPNILRVHDFGEDKGFIYLVTEYLTGGTLRDRIGKPILLDSVIETLTPLASALDYAHSRDVIHRDIKPANILLDEEGTPILTDFGLARLMEAGAKVTGTGAVVGTPEYISPEQALGRPVDHRCDLYAFGVTAYQMLLGRTPFHTSSPTETLMAHIHQEVPLPRSLDPDIEPRLEATLIKALAKNPEDRSQTATELVHMLDPIQFTEEYEPVRHDPHAAGPETLEAGIVSGYGRAPDEESISSLEGTISFVTPSQARLVAIRHARENPEFYGLRYTGVRMAWEVVSQEDHGEFYEIRLHYRPAGKFRGQPGLEEFTVSKTGQVELRQILDEPSGPLGLPLLPPIAVGAAFLAAIAVGIWFAVR